MNCRCCNSDEFICVPNAASLAPFFAKRVWGMRASLNWRSEKVNLFNKLTLGFIRKLTPLIQVDAGICKKCGFWSTHSEISSDNLSRLYVDYRSETYNNERESFEPGYIKEIAPLVGTEHEAIARLKALNKYFNKLSETCNFDLKTKRNAMDWGGADGRFLPELNITCSKSVYEISNIPTVQGVTRKHVLSDSDNYDYIQITHVLEHVSNPYEFLKDPLKHLENGGHLYLEVPLEIDDTENIIENVISCKVSLTVHEHINQFTSLSLSRLALAHNLAIVDITVEEVDLGWCKMKMLRLLANKPE